MSATISEIVFYYPGAVHEVGGVATALWQWAKSLEDVNRPVRVVYDSALLRSEEAQRPGTIECVPLRHLGRGRFRIPLGLGRAVDRHAIVALQGGYVGWNLLAGEILARRKISYVLIPHGAYNPCVRGRRSTLRRVWEIAERRLAERATAVHVFFEPEVEHARALAPDASIIVAPTGYSIPSLRWCASRTGGYVSWLGRYDVYAKGIDRLLDAMTLLPAERRPFVRMHGRDHTDSRETVQAAVQRRELDDYVYVGGPIDGPDKERFLLEAAAYVHPARWEAYGISLVESLALGVPCVLTSDIAIAGRLREHDAALVTDTTVRGLAIGLDAVGSGKIQGYSERGREFVRTQLSHEAAASSFISGLGHR